MKLARFSRHLSTSTWPICGILGFLHLYSIDRGLRSSLLFFAYGDDPLGEKPEQRSIFVYCERPAAIKGGTLGKPYIRSFGPYVETHQRHFRQRCDYTICGTFDKDYGWRFDSYQAVFDEGHPKQDRLWRFDLPSKERKKVLSSLGDYNLNAFSLFGSEESLLETMWFRE